MKNKHKLPVVRDADDLLQLATKTASCLDCRHVMNRGTAIMRCGARGGAWCQDVNPKASCVHWQSRPPKRSAPPNTDGPSRSPYLWLSISIALVLGTLVAVELQDPDVCTPYVEMAPQHDISVGCDHPEHEMSLDGDFVVCQCPQGTADF